MIAGTPATVADESASTASVVDAESAPRLVAIVVVPAPTPVAMPLEPALLLITATPICDELHVTAAVMFWVLPSL